MPTISFAEDGPLVEPLRKVAGLKCECGWYAKFAGDRHYYNGTFDCYSYTVDCKRCGLVTVECT